MKQIIQSFKTGKTILEEVPCPAVGDGQVLIKTTRSLVSLGTEKMLVEFGKASLIQKARQQPEKVRMVLDKIQSEGLLPTLEAVFKKLGQPIPLGYCNVGKVLKVGKGVTDFKVGDRVASNGPHAEFVCVPQNLVTHIPKNVSDEEAAFTVIGSIGLQGIRLLKPTLGETFVVTGLGLIGLITAQLLKSNGCNVIGLDVAEDKIRMGKRLGLTCFNPSKGDTVKFINSQTEGIGADGVIITASSKSNEIISQAANMSRKRGRIILVGVIGLDLNRSEFYEKELSFQVSCSYGPGRYDPLYEDKGIDYPLPFVRWTEKRNFEALLNAISLGNIDVKSLITEIVPLEDFEDIYREIGQSSSIASILKYSEDTKPTTKVSISDKVYTASKNQIAIIGAGNFTKMTLLPNLDTSQVKYIVSKGGLSAKTLASKYKIPYCSTDFTETLADPEIGAVIVTTRHDLHAKMTSDALKSGKHVFVEKPLALSDLQLKEVISSQKESNKSIMVGFNRRFSKHIQKIKSLVPNSSLKNMTATMNAGHIPDNVWVHDMEVGGGRIIGEACHYIDLLIFISGSLVKSVCMNSLGVTPKENTDNASILLKFENGDQGIINYFSNGNKSYSKERLEVYFDEQTLIMDNFRKTRGYGTKGFSKLHSKLDKGHKKQFELYSEFIEKGGNAPIPLDQIINVSKASLAAVQSLKTNAWVTLS